MLPYALSSQACPGVSSSPRRHPLPSAAAAPFDVVDVQRIVRDKHQSHLTCIRPRFSRTSPTHNPLHHVQTRPLGYRVSLLVFPCLSMPRHSIASLILAALPLPQQWYRLFQVGKSHILLHPGRMLARMISPYDPCAFCLYRDSLETRSPLSSSPQPSRPTPPPRHLPPRTLVDEVLPLPTSPDTWLRSEELTTSITLSETKL